MTLPLVWAFWFLNPLMLYALAAAGVPVVIHMLNRRKHREVPWAAMRFLLAAIRKNRRRLRLEQWLLLAIRTLVILLVVSAMAEPYLEKFGALIAGGRTHKVIVLDDSLSMAYKSGEESRFDQARRLAAQLVKDARGGDGVSLILMGSPPRVVIPAPSRNLDEVKKVIEEQTQSDGGTDLARAFEKIESVLELSPNDQKEIIFLTDLQATSWRSPSNWSETIKRLQARRPRSVVIDVGKTGGENRAVTDLKLETPVVTVGSSVLIRAGLRNFGVTRADGVRARLTSDGRLGPDEAVDLTPGEPVSVVFRQQFETPGDHLVEVSIDSDPLERDNHRWLVVPVRESLNVLLVDGDYKSEPYQAETDYLAQALAPGEESPGQPRPIKVDVAGESGITGRDLEPYDVVVLCNVHRVNETEVTYLEEFLKQGGGLVVFVGDMVSAENYNRFLFADGTGLLPAEIGPSVGDAARKQGGFFFNPLGYRHPIVAAYGGETEPVTSGLTQARTLQYHQLRLPAGSQAEVALAFDSRDPAIVQSRRHRGRVFLVATSADTGWTNWPIHKSYVPVMQEMILQAAAGKLSNRNIRVGEPFDQSFAGSAASAPATVLTPSGQSIATALNAGTGASEFHFEKTDLAGEYRVKVGPPVARESSFAANTDPAESDPAKLDRAGLTAMFPGWNFQYETGSRELTEDTSSVGRHGELHRPLLYGLLILLLVESFLAWKFGHHESSS